MTLRDVCILDVGRAGGQDGYKRTGFQQIVIYFLSPSMVAELNQLKETKKLANTCNTEAVGKIGFCRGMKTLLTKVKTIKYRLIALSMASCLIYSLLLPAHPYTYSSR